MRHFTSSAYEICGFKLQSSVSKTSFMTNLSIPELQKKANGIRKDIIKMLTIAGSGHSAGSLGLTDIFTALYFNVMTLDPQKPDWEDRDRLILSNGHTCPALYATLAHAGYFPIGELKTLRKLDSRLQGHPERDRLPGIETTSGPLGCGLAQAAGIALAARLDDKRFRIYCVTSDGEHDEGNHWEAVMFAAKYNLSNLTNFVDRNKIQQSGFTEEILPLEPLRAKYEAFNWKVLEIDGHDFTSIIQAVEMARKEYERPTAIIANTISGKGVSFMEGRWEWHAKAPNKEETLIALKELKK
jgi:transketolase